jgi:hypothetical protein
MKRSLGIGFLVHLVGMFGLDLQAHGDIGSFI